VDQVEESAAVPAAAKRWVRLKPGDWACFLGEASIIIVLLLRRMLQLKVSMKGSG